MGCCAIERGRGTEAEDVEVAVVFCVEKGVEVEVMGEVGVVGVVGVVGDVVIVDSLRSLDGERCFRCGILDIKGCSLVLISDKTESAVDIMDDTLDTLNTLSSVSDRWETTILRSDDDSVVCILCNVSDEGVAATSPVGGI